jgi:threonine/homoserine/homoserine lactone efflux protein
VLFAYGTLASSAARLLRTPRFTKATNRMAGTLLVGAGLGLGLADSD